VAGRALLGWTGLGWAGLNIDLAPGLAAGDSANYMEENMLEYTALSWPGVIRPVMARTGPYGAKD
jgi:hypothetical protein